TGPTGIDTAIDGIFLDQMANFPAETVPGPDGVTVQEYYSEIYAHMQTKPAGRRLLVGNPGDTAPTDWQFNPATRVADIVTVFERDPATFAAYVFEPWLANYPPERISMMVYAVPQAEIADQFPELKA